MNSNVIRYGAFLYALFGAPIQLFAASPYPYSTRVVAKFGDVVRGTKVIGALDGPTINNSGVVAFQAGFYGGGAAVMTSSGTAVLTGDVVDGKQILSVAWPSINDHGEIVYVGDYGTGGGGIFTSTKFIAGRDTVIGGKTLTSTGTQRPVINNDGVIAFKSGVTTNDPSGDGGIFTQTQRIAMKGEVIAGVPMSPGPDTPQINNAGAVAFRGGGAFFVNNQVVAKQGDVVDGSVITTVGVSSLSDNLNDLGQIAYVGDYFGGTGIVNGVVFDGHFIARTGTPIGSFLPTSFETQISLNNSGNVLFLARSADGSGIFTRDGLVVKTGDFLDGKQISQFGYSDINDLGQIAIDINFKDSTSAIYVFTPVPEPSSLALAGLGAGVLLVLARRRYCRLHT